MEIPDNLNVALMSNKLKNETVTQHKRQKSSWFYALAASVLMVVSGSVGWFSHDIVSPQLTENTINFVNSAISAHQVYSVEVLHPVEMSADKSEDLVAWLSKRVDHSLKVPNLELYGYKFLGGRLLAMYRGSPAAQFMFENKEGNRVTLLVSKNKDYHDQSFHFKNKNNVKVFYWMEENVAYSISSEMNTDTLRELSETVYKQLNIKKLANTYTGLI